MVECLQLVISDSEKKIDSFFHLATLIFIVAEYYFEIKQFFPLISLFLSPNSNR